MIIDTQEIGYISGRFERNSDDNVTQEEAVQHCCGGRACTGCLTGNPCPACIIRQARINGTMQVAKAVNE